MLDIGTIYATSLAVLTSLAAVMGKIWWRDAARYQGIGLWFFGIVCAMGGFALVAGRQPGLVPLAWSVVVGIGLLPAGLAMTILGLERFFGLASSWRWQLLFVLATLAWQTVFLHVNDDVHARIVGFNSLVLAQVWMAAWRLHYRLDAELRTLSGFSVIVLVGYGLLFLYRIVHALPLIGEPSPSPLYDPTGARVLFAFLVLTILMTVSLIVLLFRAQSLRLERSNAELLARQQELEDYRASLEDRVQAASRRLAETEKLAAMGTLASGIGHEISNPNQIIAHNLSAVDTFLRQLLGLIEPARLAEQRLGTLTLAELAPRVERSLEMSRRASQRITAIINDLRELSRPEQQQDWAEYDLRLLITQAIAFCQPTLEQHRARVQPQLPDAPMPCWCSAHAIEQVLINLLRNAAEAMNDKAAEPVVIRLEIEAEAYRISVEDHGCGIAAEHLAQATSPFFTTRRESGGTGLGLYMVARIVKALHGELVIDSEPGRGTRVSVFLPRESAR